MSHAALLNVAVLYTDASCEIELALSVSQL